MSDDNEIVGDWMHTVSIIHDDYDIFLNVTDTAMRPVEWGLNSPLQRQIRIGVLDHLPRGL